MNLNDIVTSKKSSILLIGPPGTGKTTLATQLSRPIIYNCDNNYKGAVLFVRDHKLKTDAEIVIPHIKDDGTVVPRVDRYKTLAKLAGEAAVNEKYDTIVIDSLTTFRDYAEDEVRRQQKRAIADGVTVLQDAPLQIQDWGAFAALVKHFFITLKSSQKQIVVCAHVETREDESVEASKVLLKYLAFPGQLRETLAGLFDEVWILDIEQRTVGGAVQHVRTIRTQPSSFREAALGLKTAVGIGAKCDLDFTKLQTALSR